MTIRRVGAQSFNLQQKQLCCLCSINSSVQLFLYTSELFQYSLFLLQLEKSIYSLLCFDVLCFCALDSHCMLIVIFYLAVC